MITDVICSKCGVPYVSRQPRPQDSDVRPQVVSGPEAQNG